MVRVLTYRDAVVINSLLPRLPHLLLVSLLLLGQVGGWLHELSHHVGAEAARVSLTHFGDEHQRRDAGSSVPDEESDRQCLLCLTFSVMGLGLPGLVLAFSLLSLQFPVPGAARRFPHVIRPCAHSARGPPLFS